MIEPENAPNWMHEFFKWQQDYLTMVAKIAFLQAMEQRTMPIDNTEPDNTNLVPISDAEAYRAMDAVSRIETIADMGIFPPTRWKVIGRCSWHGFQVHTIETVNKVPDEQSILCWDCVANNVNRRLPVLEVSKSTE